MPGLRIRRKPPPPTPDTVSAGTARCRIPTLIKRATGTCDRYALSAVRALPLRFRGSTRPTREPGFRHNVVLQASDGHQAVCVLTTGAIEAPILIPGEVLPTRHADCDSGVALDGNIWRSREGQEAPPVDPDAPFPAIGSVLPELRPGTIAVAISVERLRRISAALGTDTVTLMVPPPGINLGSSHGKNNSGGGGREQDDKPSNVTSPIAVCPAGKDDTDGVAVMMPVNCDRAHAYYHRIREAVVTAEDPGKRRKRERIERPGKEVAA